MAINATDDKNCLRANNFLIQFFFFKPCINLSRSAVMSWNDFRTDWKDEKGDHSRFSPGTSFLLKNVKLSQHKNVLLFILQELCGFSVFVVLAT